MFSNVQYLQFRGPSSGPGQVTSADTVLDLYERLDRAFGRKADVRDPSEPSRVLCTYQLGVLAHLRFTSSSRPRRSHRKLMIMASSASTDAVINFFFSFVMMKKPIGNRRIVTVLCTVGSFAGRRMTAMVPTPRKQAWAI